MTTPSFPNWDELHSLPVVNPFLSPTAIVPNQPISPSPAFVPQPQYPHNFVSTPVSTATSTYPAPSAPTMDPLNHAFLALRLQDEYKSTQNQQDEEVARLLAAEEQTKRQAALEREKADNELARKLASEEQQQEANRLEETRKREEAKKREEVERKMREADKKLKLAQDEALAKKIAEDEQKQLQLRKDFDLARKLDEQEKKAASPPPSSFVYPSVHNSPSSFNTYNRDHVVTIHNRYCYCGNTQPYNNNHLHNIHTTHCNCGFSLHAVQYPNSNHGRKHVHDHRCCGINHIHSATCYCAYRNHQHNHMCCSLNHTHDDNCHCCAK